MSKYTAERVLEYVEKAERGYFNPVHMEMLRDYADLLRERESAKAAVTDEMVEYASRVYTDASPLAVEAMRSALEAVAPMLASARVPDARKLRLNGNVRQQSYDQGWNACRAAMLAAATKPEEK